MSAPVIELLEADITPAQSLLPTAIIQGVNWRVDPGSFWAVAGLPGCGKTDLLSTAAGLQKPVRGEHLIFGRNVRLLDEFELVQTRLRIGMVFSTGRLFTQLSIRDNVALPICYHRNCGAEQAAADVDFALRLTDLEAQGASRPVDVTRNIHCRIGLARALALRPEALLIDNPLTGIDPREAVWWVEFLAKISRGHDLLDRKPITLVVTTDDFRPWVNRASDFALIENRKWIPLGNAEALKSSEAPMAREFLGANYKTWT